MDPRLIFGVLLLLGLVWTGVWGWVLFQARGVEEHARVVRALGALRRRLLVLFLAVLVVGFAVSLRWLPYPIARAGQVGTPSVVVEVRASQWRWEMDRTEVPLGVPVEFRVTALDVNHGFGVFDASGRLVAQVQAMPGYTNRLILRFDRPGTYRILCLEYCGIGHHLMQTELQVR